MLKKPTIRIARGVGACFGVKKALEILDSTLGVRPQTLHVSTSGVRPQIYMLGQIIHNPAVIAKYQAQGVQVLDVPDDKRALLGVSGAVVVVRTHGIDPRLVSLLSASGNSVIDATCPRVKVAQKQAVDFATKYGKVVIIGEDGHPEVAGLCGCVEAEGGVAIVVAEGDTFAKDVKHTDLLAHKFGVIAQTTQRQEKVDEIRALLDEHSLCYEYANTLCAATAAIQRQSIELAGEVELMLVVGGKNSANTKHLAQSCQNVCRATHQIEDCSDIKAAWLNVATIGITGGASTPLGQLGTVADYLEEYCEQVCISP